MAGDLSEPRFSILLLYFSRLALLCFTWADEKVLPAPIFNSVVCHLLYRCALFARALFNPFNVHPSFVMLLITASHNIHSCNALLSFFIIYIHKMCTIKSEEEEGKYVKQEVISRSRSMKRKVFLSALSLHISAEALAVQRLRPAWRQPMAYLPAPQLCPNIST